MTCPSCSAAVPDGARFCPTCGHPLQAPADERRVVTVLFGDLVGFTALSETRDPEQVKNLVDSCFARLADDITSFGGRVDKIVGDAVVAIFGAPQAHEDDAERAVRAALQMHRTIAQLDPLLGGLRMRIGVNSGEVLVGALRAGGDYTAMGDVVNAAARLQTAALPGQVVVGPETHAATTPVFRYEPLGRVQVRGRDEPIEAWAAVEAVVAPGQRTRSRTPLVGRAPEVGLLCHALTAAVGARRPHLALVVGEAGMGKSRLAEEVSSTARDQHGALVLDGRSLPYGEANVWWPLADAIRQASGIAPDDSADEARAKCLAAVSAAGGGSPEDPEHVRTTDGLLYLLGVDGSLRDVDPGRARDEAGRALRVFLHDLAADRPVVLALSDVQWADDAVLELVDGLLEGPARLPLVVLLTARPELEGRWSPRAGAGNLVVLNLDPLDRTAAEQLVDTLLEGPVDRDVRELLVERSGGNPFFLEELAGLLRESGALAGVGTGDVRGLPATLRGLVAARLDALPRDQRAVLDDAAVLGRRGGVQALEALARARGAEGGVREALDGLVGRDLVLLRDERVAFRSDLVREVAYGTLTKAERARRHASFAVWLEGVAKEKERTDEMLEELARHYASAAELSAEVGVVDGVPGAIRDRALEALQRAADRSEDRETHLVADRLYDQQLRLLGDEPSPPRRHALIGRARARTALRQLEAAASDLEAVLAESAEAGDDVARARALVVRGDLERNRLDFDASLATLAEARSLWASLDDRRGEASALRRIGLALLFAGDLGAAEEPLQEALTAFQEIGSRRGVAWASQNLAWISFYRGEQDVAEARLNDAISLFADIGDWGGLSWSLGLMAWVQYSRGHRDEAERLAFQSRDEGGVQGDRWASGMMTVLLSAIRLWKGRSKEAVEHGERARALFRELSDTWGEIRSLGPLSRALLVSGHPDAARRAVEEAAVLASALPDGDSRGVPGVMAAGVEVHAGHGEEALAALEPIGSGFAADEVVHIQGLALAQTGRAAEAVAGIERALAGIDDVGPRSSALSALALAAAAAGDPEAAVARAEEVAALQGGTYLDLALALLGAACGQAQLGRHDEAVAALDEARDVLAATDDQVSPAVAALARGRVLAALGDPDADRVLAAAAAAARVAGLGPGWDALFRQATVVPSLSP